MFRLNVGVMSQVSPPLSGWPSSRRRAPARYRRIPGARQLHDTIEVQEREANPRASGDDVGALVPRGTLTGRLRPRDESRSRAGAHPRPARAFPPSATVRSVTQTVPASPV
jgi:hypothetical protein